MKRLGFLLAAISIVALILACGGGGGGGGSGGDRARVRVVNANPDANLPYNVTFGDEDSLPDIGYAEYTGYLRVPFGDLDVHISDNISVAPIVSVTHSFENRGYYTLVLLQNAATPTPGSETTAAATATVSTASAELRSQMRADTSPTASTTGTASSGGSSAAAITANFFDDSREPPEGNNFKIRVINAATTLSSADVYVTRAGGDLSRTSPISAALSFGSAGEYVQAAAGTVQVRVTRSGKKSEIFNSGDLEIEASDIVSVVLLDQSASGRSIQAIVLHKD